MADPDATIHQLQASLDQIPPDQPERVQRLEGLGVEYAIRYQRTGTIADLNMAIKWLQAAVDETPLDYPGYPHRCESLGMTYRDRYRRTDSIIDMDMAIRWLQVAVDQTPLDHIEHGERLTSLALGYHDRHLRTNNITDLDTAIKWLQFVVDQIPLDHPGRSKRLHGLGAVYGNRYRRTGDTTDLDTAIKWLQASVDQTPLDDPEYLHRLRDLGAGYGNRYQGLGNIADLDISIKSFQASIDQTPLDHPERPDRLHSLAIGYANRYHRTDNPTDLNAAIECHQASVDQTPSDYPERADRLHGLGIGYHDKYLRTSNATDLDTAIDYYQTSIDQTPLDHSERAARLHNLGAGYRDRYLRTGSITDMDMAIKRLQVAVDQTPLDHIGRAHRLYGLGGLYLDRHQTMGSNTDLDTAIKLLQASVDQTPLDYPERAHRLHGLGDGYNSLQIRTGNVAHLDTAMKYYQASIDQTPCDNSELTYRLHGLGRGYLRRYKLTRSTTDLDVAIKWFQVAVDQTPPDHPERALRLHSLGRGYHNRYHRTDNTDDLNTAIEFHQASINQTPLNHPERSDRLYDIGNLYHDRHRRIGSTTDLNTGIAWFREATDVSNSPVRDRLRAAIKLLPYYASTQNWKDAYDIAHGAVQLVPLLTPRFLKVADKQRLLARVAGLASDAVAMALNLGKDAFDAAQLLELGRGVISGSLTEMRIDITTLASNYPELAHEFVYLRDLLDSPETSADGELLSSSTNESDLRYDAQNKMEGLLSEIRSKRGLEDFLLASKREDLQSAAASGAIVIVNVSPYRCDAILVEPHVIRSIPLTKLSSKDIEKKARECDFGSSETLCWLWDTIANPVLEALGMLHPPSNGRWPHIWWIPTRLLTKFPLHAAGRHEINSSETVLDRTMSSYSSSIKAMLHRRGISPLKTAQPVLSQALLVAVADAPGSRSLPFAKREVAMVREVCQSMAVDPIEPGRRKSDVISCLPQCKIFHFAGHGFTDGHDPSRSFLLLEDWKSDPLTVANLLEVYVRDNLPFLAYLSACGTAQIRDEKLLDESIHLISAFQLAGFRHVIGTLWEVADEVCVDVAKITYEGIKDGSVTDESVCLGLHNASRKLRDEWLSTKSSKRDSSQRSRARNANHGDDRQIESARDAVICDDEDEEGDEGSLSWVPYVHYGV